MPRTLVDTGPIVALLSPHDAAHRACTEVIRDLQAPLHTCWPVIVEATWLLRKLPRARSELFRSFETGLLSLIDLDASALPYISEFMQRYSDLPADLADAALVYLAERERIDCIFTVDRRDFSVYRTSAGAALELLGPPLA